MSICILMILLMIHLLILRERDSYKNSQKPVRLIEKG